MLKTAYGDSTALNIPLLSPTTGEIIDITHQTKITVSIFDETGTSRVVFFDSTVSDGRMGTIAASPIQISFSLNDWNSLPCGFYRVNPWVFVSDKTYPAKLQTLQISFTQGGPNDSMPGNISLTVDDVRQHLMDFPEYNLLLADKVELTDDELYEALSHAIRQYNEFMSFMPTYTVSTMPFQGAYEHGVVGHALELAASRFMRNQLQYTAGGVAINDQDKATPYMQAAQRYLQEYQQWIEAYKTQQNLEDYFGSIGSKPRYMQNWNY